jgi:NAD(P)-dependent dehydrogenase (short-subunit alcohol dehydrogenase family)
LGKIVLITGSTDGIGLETARMLVSLGHHVLLHGRDPTKLATVEKALAELPGDGRVESYLADLSSMANVEALARAIKDKYARLDVLINNAGIFHTPEPITQNGLDIRFAVNTIAPYLLTQRLLPLLDSSGRVINLSSAAQAPVSANALLGQKELEDMPAYSQSKLALTMWSRHLALALGDAGPSIIAVNPGSLLGSKMVKEGFGVEGKDLKIGADILTRLALSDEFESVSGKYFDNDSGQFASPHMDVTNPQKCKEVVSAIEMVLARSA